MSNFMNYLLKNMFIISSNPITLKDLLQANSEFDDNLLVDPAKLHFKFNYAKSYIIFGILFCIVLLPIIMLSHKFFTKVNIHISILFTIIMTSFVFVGFDIFKMKARKILTQNLIKKAWETHFPYFSYENFHKPASKFYKEAIKNEIPKNELEKFIIEKMVKKD